MSPFVRAGVVLVLVSTAGPARAANQQEIDTAVQRGVAYLKAQYKGERPGLPAGLGHGIGPTALTGIALLEAKTPATDPAVRGIAAAVREAALRETKTYQASLCLIFLDLLEDPADEPLIQVLAVRLLAGQTGQGGWGYSLTDPVADETARWLQNVLKTNQLATTPAGPEPGKAPREEKPAGRAGRGGKLHPEVERYSAALMARRGSAAVTDDNSNTQFGLLAVWAARKHGVPVDEALDLVEKRFLATQDPQSGGWTYSGMGMMAGTSPAMTCAGLIGLSTGVARREEKRAAAPPPPKPKSPTGPKATDPFFNPPASAEKPAAKKPDPKRQPEVRNNVPVQRGLACLGAHLVNQVRGVQGGPNGPGAGGMERDLYFLWSLERVGVIYGVEKIGGLDWYAVGADALVKMQARDGSWGTGGGYGNDVCTSFAVLFLVRANIARDLSNKVRKDPSSTELRAGSGPARGETGPAETQPGEAAAPAGTGSALRPLPTPVADGAPKLATQLVGVPAADWTKALGTMRDAKGQEHTRALVLAIHQLDGDRKKEAREALAERLTRMTADTLQGMTKATDVELRRGAVLACAMKDDKAHVPHLIDRLTDDEDLVVRAARAGLKSLTGQDFGPAPGSTKEQRKAAADAWRGWWAKQK